MSDVSMDKKLKGKDLIQIASWTEHFLHVGR